MVVSELADPARSFPTAVELLALPPVPVEAVVSEARVRLYAGTDSLAIGFGIRESSSPR